MIPSLDGIRAVSVFIVLLAHAGLGHVVPGGFGVTTFFFLSGYLITRLFIDERAHAGRVDIKGFYLRRVIRLSPPLIITLAVVYGLQFISAAPGSAHPSPLLCQALYCFNYYQLYGSHPREIAAGTEVLWSLAVEEHFYLIYPFAFLLMTSRLRAGALIFIGLLAPLVLRLIKYHILGVSPHAIYIATDTRIDSILFGCALAFLERSPTITRFFPETPFGRWMILGAAIAVLCFTFLYRDPAFRATYRYTLQGIALAPLFYYAVRMPSAFPFSILNTPVMRWIGVRSYTMYLIHFVAIHMLIDYGVPRNDVFALFLAGGGIAAAYAAIMYRFVESPLARLRKSLRIRRARRASDLSPHPGKEQCYGA